MLGLSNIHNKTVANLVTAKMLHCYSLVNTLQMYTLNSVYSPIMMLIAQLASKNNHKHCRAKFVEV